MPVLAIAGLLLGHGLIHASYLTPRPAPKPGAPEWPFELERSWLLTRLGVAGPTSRMIGMALVVATIAGFGLAAVAALGVGPAGLWVTGVVLGAVASLATLVLFFHPWLAIGLAIDVVLLVAVVGWGWTPIA